MPDLRLDGLPPGSWGVVMACGLVSIDLSTIGQQVLSLALFWFATAVWLLLVVRVASSLARAVTESKGPAMLGSVTATAVIGTRFAASGDRAVGAVLLAIAAAALAALAGPVITHWTTPATGTSFLLSVATQAVAVLSAIVAASYRAGWLVGAAGLLWLAGLVCYVVVVGQFDLKSVATGAGDQWVAGGALAIAALAAGKITVAGATLKGFGGWHDPLAMTTLVLWCLAMAWLVLFVVSEVAWPRLTYDVLRWATVFPLGMYAASGFVTGQITGIEGITEFAKAWTWVVFAVTMVVLAGLARRTWRYTVPPPTPARRG